MEKSCRIGFTNKKIFQYARIKPSGTESGINGSDLLGSTGRSPKTGPGYGRRSTERLIRYDRFDSGEKNGNGNGIEYELYVTRLKIFATRYSLFGRPSDRRNWTPSSLVAYLRSDSRSARDYETSYSPTEWSRMRKRVRR